MKAIVRIKGCRIAAAAITLVVFGWVFFLAYRLLSPTVVADKIAAIGVIVNVLFGAATATTAFVAYRLGARDAVGKIDDRRRVTDVAASMIFAQLTGINAACNIIVTLIGEGADKMDVNERVENLTIMSDKITELLPHVDRKNVEDIGLCEMRIAVNLGIGLGRVRFLLMMCSYEIKKMQDGHQGPISNRSAIISSADHYMKAYTHYNDYFMSRLSIIRSNDVGFQERVSENLV